MRPRVLIRVYHVLRAIGHQPKVLLQHRIVHLAFQVGTKTSLNKLNALIVQLEELQPRSAVKLNAIYVPQAAIKKTAV